MAKNKKSVRKKHKPAREIHKSEPHEIFTARRLIIFFAVLEIMIIALMFPTFHGRWHMNQAKQAMRDKNFQKAYKHYTWLGKHTPAGDNATFNLELGNVCFNLKKYQEAIRHYMKVVELTDGQAGSFSQLGIAYLRAGDEPKAREFFLKELESNPRDPQANYHLGKLAFEDKNYTEATSYFARVAYLPHYRKRLKPYWETIERQVLQK